MHDGFLNSRPRLVGGGLEALQRFFEALPIDSGLAFVVIAHLDPTQKSYLGDLLRHKTSLPVVNVTKRLRLNPTKSM
jgi:two-component system CheB/CheR fusion protein